MSTKVHYTVTDPKFVNREHFEYLIKPINYTKDSHDLITKRYTDLYFMERQSSCADYRFHNFFQMDWYKSVIVYKKVRTTLMKWID